MTRRALPAAGEVAHVRHDDPLWFAVPAAARDTLGWLLTASLHAGRVPDQSRLSIYKSVSPDTPGISACARQAVSLCGFASFILTSPSF